MKKQFDPLICLQEMHFSLKSINPDLQFLSLLLKKFNRAKINNLMDRVKIQFLSELPHDKEPAILKFIQDFDINRHLDNSHLQVAMLYIKSHMNELIKRVEQTRLEHIMNKQNLQNKVDYQCKYCKHIYATAAGLHYHKLHSTKIQCLAIGSQQKHIKTKKIDKNSRPFNTRQSD